jgi:hypothetical protein
VLALLLCSQAICLLATRAATRQSGDIRVHSLDFYYKEDENARFLHLKNTWQSQHRGEISLTKSDELATEAYRQAGVEAPFTRWRYQGGPSPKVFTSKIHLYNNGKRAVLNLPLKVSVRAKVGELRVKPDIQMTDYGYLQQTAHWEDVSSNTITVPALAPNEDMLVEVMRFRLMNFLAAHPNQWPTQVEVTVSAPQMATVRKSLPLVPDHFVVPTLY